MPSSTLLAAAQEGYRDPTGERTVTGRTAVARAIGAWMHASGRTMPRHLAPLAADRYEVNDMTVTVTRRAGAVAIARET